MPAGQVPTFKRLSLCVEKELICDMKAHTT